ncbi:single-stranded-DNA-specific exonuclease RecJ [Amaricoccus macauensis]|uniref:single-stranded-DNA-specific exonuclease RecJ n=1 Tax=Amaricoccus macauensis TaxID=57001 RepID=UPI003C79AAF0
MRRRWLGATTDEERHALALAQTCGIPEILATILARRGIAPGEATGFLAPTLRDLLPDPSSLRDMDKAASRFHEAVKKRERIAIFADYDVDGGASAALLVCWLRHLGIRPTLYIPDRLKEGYGPNTPAMERLGCEHDLIVCVDCGTLSHDPIAAAQCDVIVLDHHLAGETMPDCIAVVNPNRHDDDSGLGHICAAAVVFLMLVGVNRLMRAESQNGPNLLGLLDLVALATVADVAPLKGLNRAFVRQGLAVMSEHGRPGIAALASVAKLKTAPTCHTLGFVFGPRVNAGGRIGAPDIGARLLSTADHHEAAALAERLDRLNTERRSLEAAVANQALDQVEARGEPGPLIWAASEGWHPGVVGIVASRLKEAFGRPAIVIGFDGEAGKGSGRSAGGLDMGACIARLRDEGLIEKGGGHKAAVGLSLTQAQLGPAMSRLEELIAEAGAAPEVQDEMEISGVLGVGGATLDAAEAIAQAGPFGMSAPAPRVAIADARISRFRPVGESHLSLTLSDSLGGRLEAISFGAFESDFGETLNGLRDRPIHFAGRLERDDWGGRSKAKLFVEDAAPARD